jgi:hypothetical protein
MDKSKENTRIADLLAMDTEKVRTKIAMGITNPQIYKDFIESEGLNWDYAVAGGILEEEDVKWIKEHANEWTEPTSEDSEM